MENVGERKQARERNAGVTNLFDKKLLSFQLSQLIKMYDINTIPKKVIWLEISLAAIYSNTQD